MGRHMEQSLHLYHTTFCNPQQGKYFYYGVRQAKKTLFHCPLDLGFHRHLAFLVVNLTASGMNYKPEMEDTCVRDLSAWFVVGDSTPSQDLLGMKTFIFDPELKAGTNCLGS